MATVQENVSSRPVSPQQMFSHLMHSMSYKPSKPILTLMGSRAISKLSHEESAYQETEDGEPIPYHYADQLKVQVA